MENLECQDYKYNFYFGI